MKENYCDISVVMDTSLSMFKIIAETQDGFNAWLNSQKALDGEATISLTEFNNFFRIAYQGIDVKNAPEFILKPAGNTALYDAIGKTIKDTGYRLDRMKEEDKPSKVLIVIITDGEENCSRLYNRQDILEMITHQKEKYSWEFVFLGSNIDAEEVGSTFGISKEYAMTYAANDGGVAAMYRTLTCNAALLRSDAYVVGKGFFKDSDKLYQSHAMGN